MRELTKSIISFSWAVSLLGLKEATNLFQRPAQAQRADSPGCEPVTQAAVAQLDPSFQGIFRTGDNFQRGIVNAMFGIFNPGSWNFLRTRPETVNPANPTNWSPANWNPTTSGHASHLRQDGPTCSDCSGQKKE